MDELYGLSASDHETVYAATDPLPSTSQNSQSVENILVNTFHDPQPNTCNDCQKYFDDMNKKVSQCLSCYLRIHLTCLRKGV